jgi:hypothetical protein
MELGLRPVLSRASERIFTRQDALPEIGFDEREGENGVGSLSCDQGRDGTGRSVAAADPDQAHGRAFAVAARNGLAERVR